MSDRLAVLGVPVDACSSSEFMDRIQSALCTRGAKSVFAVNAEKIMRARRDSELFHALKGSDFLIPDGFGPVVGLKLLHGRRVDRTTGVGLMRDLVERAAGGGIRVFILGARPETVEAAARNLRNRFPKLELVGFQHGYFAPGEQEDIVLRINRLDTDVLFVGLGSPRQELWIHKNKSKLNVRLCVGVGGSINVMAGEAALAPAWISRIYMEWLFRLISDPSRFKRYRVIPVFIFRLLAEAVRRR